MTIQELIQVIRGAGEIVLSARRIDAGVQNKSGNANFVTEYDSAVQAYLFRELAALYPDAAFVGEEDDADNFAALREGDAFVIDPIDGTANFIHRMAKSAISVALCRRGEPILAVVYDPYADEVYCAEAGQGAYILARGHRREMHVSTTSLIDGLALVGTSPYYTDMRDRTFASMRAIADVSGDLRRFGSAALDLSMLADGRAEVFYEAVLSPWDYAAGMLLVKEAGGIAAQPDGSPLSLEHKCPVLAGTKEAVTAVRRALGL